MSLSRYSRRGCWFQLGYTWRTGTHRPEVGGFLRLHTSIIVSMKANLNLAIAVAAGFAGGILSHSFWPTPVHAQSQTAMIHSAESLRLPLFLVNEAGTLAASFTID